MYQKTNNVHKGKQRVQTPFAKPELKEYQCEKQKVDVLEAELEELCFAIEEFGLSCAGEDETAIENDARVIYCRKQRYTPAQLLAQARVQAAALEQATLQAHAARGRVLAQILSESCNLNEYRAMRWLYIDMHERCRPAQSAAKSGFVS